MSGCGGDSPLRLFLKQKSFQFGVKNIRGYFEARTPASTSATGQAVALTTKHADSSACCRMLISVCWANRSPKIEPGYIAEWICSPSAIIAYRATGL